MTTRRRTASLLLLLVTLLAGGLLACGGDDADDSTDSGTTETTEAGDDGDGGGGEAAEGIVIKGFAFSGLAVAAGETVTVSNEDDVNHTLTADDGSFDAGEIRGGSSADLAVPDEPGDYAVHCEIHSTMKGTLTVS